MNDWQWTGFITAIQTGSLSRAAADLFVSPQALAQQMDKLEAEVGTKLLVRSPRGVTTTPAGQHFYENICALGARLDQITMDCRKLGELQTDVLKIGVLSTPLFIPTICYAFSQRYPHIELKQVELNTDHDHQLLLDREIDIAESSRFRSFERDDLLYISLFEAQPVCLLRKDHPLASRSLIELDNLRGHRVGTPNAGYFYRHTELEEALIGIQLVDGIFGQETMLDFCLNGGVYVMPEPAARAMRPLVYVPLHFPMIEMGIHTRKELTPTVKLFVDCSRSFVIPDPNLRREYETRQNCTSQATVAVKD